MASKGTPLAWKRCRGRNGWDSPLDVPEDMAAEALNVHFYEGGLATKRGGSESVSISGLSGINALFRYVPGQDETVAELFAVDNSATNKILRMAGGASFTNLTLVDNLSSSDMLISFAVLNGKLYIAYDTTLNRLHVFDPGYSTTTVRRAGMGTTAAPTATDTGAGSYAATTRYYRVRYQEQRSGVVIRQGLSSAVLTSTPSGTGAALRVTKPAALTSEGETHWVLEGSADNATFYDIATTVVGTTTYDDSAAPSSYSSNTASPTAGTYTPFPSVKYLLSTGTRLIGLGVWETSAGDSLSPKDGRVFIGPVLDSTSTHDDERISNTTTFAGWIDLARNASGTDRGLGMLGNIVYAFQSKGVYGLVPTENAEVPYKRVIVSTQLGAVSHNSIIQGEDEYGRACLYFLDPELGPYRLGADGLQWIGKAVKDVWDTVNLAASNVVAHGVYYKAKSQVWWWFATGSSNDPDTMLVFDVTEGQADDSIWRGWTKWTGDLAACRCSTMMSTTLGATMSRAQKPYAGRSSGTVLLRADTGTDDAGTTFQAYVTSPAFNVEPLFHSKTVLRSFVLGEAASGVTIQQSLIKNFSEETRTDSRLLTASGTETRVLQRFEVGELAEAFTLQVQLGDSAAASNGWTLDRWYGVIDIKEAR